MLAIPQEPNAASNGAHPRRFVAAWAFRFCVLLLVSLPVILPLSYVFDEKSRGLLILENQNELTAMANVINTQFEERLRDLAVLGNLSVVRQIVENTSQARNTALERLFIEFCESSGLYDQMRLLGTNGDELLRINTRNGECYAVSPEGRQNKSDRYYFDQGMQLQRGETYVSPLDLNVENGRVETPHKPMLRFVGPVYSTDEKKIALLVLNFKAAPMLNAITGNTVSSSRMSEAATFFLNDDGDYLINTHEPARQFEFMFGDAAGFRAQYPQAWSALKRGDHSYRENTGLFIFSTVLQDTTLLPQPLRGDHTTLRRYNWTLVRYLQDDLYSHISLLTGKQRYYWWALYLFFLAVISRLLATIALRDADLAVSAQSLNVLFNEAPDGILSVDLNGRIIRANRRFLDLTGYSEDELPTLSVDRLVPQGLRETHAKYRESFSRSAERRTMGMGRDLVLVTKSGAELPVSISLNAIESGDGKSIICSIRDITTQRLAEAKSKLYQTMIEKGAECFYLIDLDNRGKMLSVNESACKHLREFNYKIISGWFVRDWLIMPEGQDISILETPPSFTMLTEKDSVIGTLAETRSADGTILPVEISINFYRDNDGKNFAYGWFHDATERVETENLQEQARERAESATKAKTDFLANMSHEIRTPLNSVIGQAWILEQRRDITDEIRDEVKKISLSGQLLLSLVNDILDLSKIEAGELSLEQIPMKISTVLDEVGLITNFQAEQKGLALRIDDIPSFVKNEVIGDPVRLRQVLLNLVSNAVKFTSTGGISVTVSVNENPSLLPADSFTQCVRFTVADSGIGIAASALTGLFDAFKQADASTTRKFGGSGLGLSIVRQLAEKMGGQVSVDSRVGEGSRFYVDIPFTALTDEQGREAGFYKDRVQVLIAEDDETQRSTLISMCEQFGWQVDAVDSGESLVQLSQQFKLDGRRIDCIITDWQLPGIDGLEALWRIHEEVGTDYIGGVLLLTGREPDELRAAPHAELPDAIMTKPIDMSVLFNTVNAAYIKTSGDYEFLIRNSSIQHSNLLWLKGVHLLVVDDSAINLSLANKILEIQGAKVSTRMNGVEALAWLSDPANTCDLVLMDVQMPVMDGNEAVKQIRAMPSLVNLPVIALTAGALASEREVSFAAGMTDYLTKPFDPPNTVRLIRKYVERSRGRALPVIELQDRISDTPDVMWPAIEGIDIESVRRRLGGNLSVFERLLTQFLNANTEFEDDIVIPGADGMEALRQRIHKFAGAAGQLGADVVFLLARKIEDGILQNMTEGLADDLAALQHSYRVLVQSARINLALTEGLEAAPPSPAESVDVDQAKLDTLLSELASHNMSALSTFANLKPALSAALGQSKMDEVEAAIGGLAFDDALPILAALKH